MSNELVPIYTGAYISPSSICDFFNNTYNYFHSSVFRILSIAIILNNDNA